MKQDLIAKDMYQFYLENTYIATAAEIEKMTLSEKPLRVKNTIYPMYYVVFYYWTWKELTQMGVTADKLSSTQIPTECLNEDYAMVVIRALTPDDLNKCGKSRKQFEREYRAKRFPLGHVL